MSKQETGRTVLDDAAVIFPKEVPRFDISCQVFVNPFLHPVDSNLHAR
jgi:hypothetical protein